MQTLKIDGLHVGILTPPRCRGYLLYVHGGPGFHGAFFEAAVLELAALKGSGLGWITYDQRGCGRSADAVGTPGHRGNIADLKTLVDHFQNPANLSSGKLLGVVGHSYGGWLAFHTYCENREINLPLIVLGTSKDVRSARNRSFALDMLELKLDQPQIHAKLLPELENFGHPLWEFQKRIREVAAPLTRRAHFIWGNLETMKWYQDLKVRVNLAENRDLTLEISDGFGASYALKEIDPAAISGKLLWILGAHDALMSHDGYYPDEANIVTTFFKSGHYPQYEEPERLMKEIEKIL